MINTSGEVRGVTNLKYKSATFLKPHWLDSNECLLDLVNLYQLRLTMNLSPVDTKCGPVLAALSLAANGLMVTKTDLQTNNIRLQLTSSLLTSRLSFVHILISLDPR